jgi:hypothetical protein
MDSEILMIQDSILVCSPDPRILHTAIVLFGLVLGLLFGLVLGLLSAHTRLGEGTGGEVLVGKVSDTKLLGCHYARETVG